MGLWGAGLLLPSDQNVKKRASTPNMALIPEDRELSLPMLRACRAEAVPVDAAPM